MAQPRSLQLVFAVFNLLPAWPESMSDSDARQRALRKLERLISGPLATARPRLYRALGISRRLAGDASGDTHDATIRRLRIAGCPVDKTTPRIRRELGL